MLQKIPQPVREIIEKLNKADFEAFIVGGCVRDLLLKNPPSGGPQDWDIATNAQPEEIQKIFPESFYKNDFGTVGIKVPRFSSAKKAEDEKEIVEVTTYRVESKYSDKRHPDKVRFAKTLEEDLQRRDFTMNALAMKVHPVKSAKGGSALQEFNGVKKNQLEIIDLFAGQKDIKNKIIRAVGNPEARFSEDALRMMRAIRFASQLDFFIEKKTLDAISKNSAYLKHISQERIHDELVKIILSPHPAEGIENLRETGLLKFILPELEKGVGIKQNLHHIYTIYKHCLLSLKYCPSLKLEVRLAALLHDIAKPLTKRGEGLHATFYNHDHAGARMAENILERLRFSREIIAKIKLLIDNHMFYYNPDEVTESSVRRLVQKVGLENIKDLIDLRIADRLGSGTPKAKPYKLRHLEYIVEKVSTDAVSVKKLKVNGNDLIKNLKIPAGPKIGAILDVLLSEVVENPEKNKKETLLKRVQILNEKNLENLRKTAKMKIEEKKEEDDQEIKKKHWVK
jgi:poly(A) polymerase/tRNA nucleotidyltransferase (CCA-adding enzyme)